MSSLMFFPPTVSYWLFRCKGFHGNHNKRRCCFQLLFLPVSVYCLGGDIVYLQPVCVIDILTQPFKKQFRLNMLYLIFANVLLNIFDSDYFSRGLRCKWTSIEFWTFLLVFHKKTPPMLPLMWKHDVDRKKKKTSFVTFMWLVQTLTRTESSVMPKHETPARFLQWEDIETLGLLP